MEFQQILPYQEVKKQFHIDLYITGYALCPGDLHGPPILKFIKNYFKNGRKIYTPYFMKDNLWV